MIKRQPNGRIDIRYQISNETARLSRRSYTGVWGNGDNNSLDAFVSAFQAVLSPLTLLKPAYFNYKRNFKVIAPEVSTANLFSGAILIFEYQTGTKFHNIWVPGVPDTKFTNNFLNKTDVDVVAFAQFILTSTCAPNGETLEAFRGGYRGFARF